MTRILSINLCGKQIISLPDSIGELKSLINLIVSTNSLTHLPNSIKKLRSLETLNVSINPITSTESKQEEVKRRFRRAGLELTVRGPVFDSHRECSDDDDEYYNHRDYYEEQCPDYDDDCV